MTFVSTPLFDSYYSLMEIKIWSKLYNMGSYETFELPTKSVSLTPTDVEDLDWNRRPPT